MFQQEEYEVYEPYPYPQRGSSSAQVGILDAPPASQNSQESSTYATIPLPGQVSEQDAFQPPPGTINRPPTDMPPPRKRPGRVGAILILTLVLAIIFGVGLFAGWEFTGKSSALTTSAVATTSVSSSSASALGKSFYSRNWRYYGNESIRI